MRRSPPPARRAPLARRSSLARSGIKPVGRALARGAVSPASRSQRLKVAGALCIGCRRPGKCDPAHVIDRSLLTVGQDDARAVVALCRSCHDAYDEHRLDLLAALERWARVELAFAVERFGLLRTLRRVSGQRWAPEAKAAA